MKTIHFLIVLVVATIGSFALNRLTLPSGGTATLNNEPAFERVMRTKTIRCGYVITSPYNRKDPNTGKLSGISTEVIEELAQRLNLKVEWTEELDWVTYISGLKTGRYDVFCGGGYAVWQEIVDAELIGPMFYTSITPWVRADDHRFDADNALLNDPTVIVSALDGSIASNLAARDFPKAKILSAPPQTDYTFNPLNVSTHKADVTILEGQIGYEYLAANPGTLRPLHPDKPLKVFPVSFLVLKGEMQLQSMLNNALTQMVYDGGVEKILQKYESFPGVYLRVAKPFVLPKQDTP
jgi:ABC-type amino acid transport substrate-binding protein